MAHIKYTDVNGNMTSMDVDSPFDAMKRLRRIPSYNGGEIERLQSGLASAFGHRKNAMRIANNNANTALNTRFNGVRIGELKTANGSQAVRTSTMTGIEVDKNGNIYGSMRDQYVSEKGGIMSVGKEHRRKIGTIDGVASGANRADKDSNDEGVLSKIAKAISVGFVTDIQYDVGSHSLMMKRTYVSVKGKDVSVDNGGWEVITVAVEESKGK